MSIQDMRRRLERLEKQNAIYGISGDPAITIQIEDLRKAINGLKSEVAHAESLVCTLRARLKVLIKQRDTLGNYVPPHIITEINIVRNRIADQKDVIRNAGYDTVDLDFDFNEKQHIEVVQNTDTITLRIPTSTYKLLLRNVQNDYGINLSDFAGD